MEGTSTGDDGRASLDTLVRFFDGLGPDGLDEYFRIAREVMRPERVVFTGYLTHAELQHLFPCCDAGLFPSLVKEAGPLVFLEALASGCFPLGTDFGGMRASIDALRDLLPDYVVDAMKLDPRDPVPDIVSHTATALQIGTRYKDVLVNAARSRHDWRAVAERLVMTLDELAADYATVTGSSATSHGAAASPIRTSGRPDTPEARP